MLRVIFFQIPFGFRGDQTFATDATVPLFRNSGNADEDLANRLCGRIFAADQNLAADVAYGNPTAATAISVCSKFF